MSASSVPSPNSPAALAKAALKRLAMDRQEPTPDNYQRAYEAECQALGVPLPARTASPRPEAPPDVGPQWSELIGRITRGLERSNKQWTTGRKKDSLQRVLSGSKHSADKLLQRLQQLTLSWDKDEPDALVNQQADAPTGATLNEASEAPSGPQAAATASVLHPAATGVPPEWVGHLHATLLLALPAQEVAAQEAQQALTAAITSSADDIHDSMQQACEQARRIIEHRHHLVDQLVGLCHALTDSLVDLTEDDSWVSGQCQAMKAELALGMTPRGGRRLHELLESTRERQKALRQEREAARLALKQMIHQMLSEIGELGQATGRFQDKLVGYADTIGQADTLESLAGVVRDLVADSRTVHGAVSMAQAKLQAEHARATELTERVRHLEDEIRKLSDEVSTDPLTQIANRRGLQRAFEAERSRVDRQQARLAIGLLDVDNFKKLNDTLGHQTGDEALKFLARRVGECLRPTDVIARYGGEEFVVLLPDTPVDEAQAVLTRLQRQLSAEFFTADERKVFITFSAGVTQYRMDEAIEAALDRADLALYEAKRTGKNRTCLG